MNKRLFILLVAFVSVCQWSWAGSKTFYAKATANVSSNSTGMGTVYASTSNSDQEGQHNNNSFSVTGSNTVSDTNSKADVTFYLFAKPNTGYAFMGWSENNNSNTTISSNSPYTVKINSNSENSNSPVSKNWYAVFKQLPTFYFSATVTPSPAVQGSASVNLTATQVYGDTPNSTSATTTARFSATPNSGYVFLGWSTTADGTNIESSANPYNKTITSTSTNSNNPSSAHLYAIFKPLPTFYFTAAAIASPVNGGTASVNSTSAQVQASSISVTSAQTTATFSATPAEGWGFSGWSTTSNGTIESTNSPYAKTIYSTSTNQGNPTNTTLYALFKQYPTSINASGFTIDVGNEQNINFTLEPNNSYRNIKYNSSDTQVATVDNNGKVTGVSVGTSTITIKAMKMDGTTVACQTTITVTVMDKCEEPTITFTPIGDGSTANVSFSSGTNGATFKYVVNGETPTTTFNGTLVVNSGDVVKAIATKTGYSDSEVSSAKYSQVKVKTPVINIDGNDVTFSCPTEGVTFHYTTNGDTPTSSSTSWTGPAAITNIPNESTIKVIATKSGCIDSDVAERYYVKGSGISNGIVTLNDLEDHTWTYYSGVDSNVDGGNYNTQYADRLYSPNPRNVKITYKGNGQFENGNAVTGVKVGIDADANTFVYYKTIENNNGYKYTTIPNPFYVRPTTGSGKNIKYYGFIHWKVTSVSGGTISGKAVGSTINADTEITFVPTSTYTANCISMEVELEAVWAEAEISQNGSFSKGYNSVERNFYIISTDTKNISASSTPCTYTSFYPNGTTNGTTAATMNGRSTRRGGFSASADSKIEYIFLNNNNSTIYANAHNLIIGRGVSNSDGNGVCATDIFGKDNNNASGLNYTIRLESGKYTNYHALAKGGTYGGTNKIRSIFGSDFDRANKNDDNLTITTSMWMGEACYFSAASNGTDGFYKCWIKSGKLITANITDGTGGTQSFYIGTSGNQNTSKYIYPRYLYIEGGETGGIAGGLDDRSYTNASDFRVLIRMTGGYIRGCLYGAGSYAPAAGERRYIITGGEIGGWVAAGCNGIGGNTTQENNGATNGDSYVYLGGAVAVGYKNATINDVQGGNIFGAGRGAADKTYDVGTINNSNVVIADAARIEKNVYGGGNYGFVASGGTATLYITGGTVDGKVFGGANMVEGQTVNINMTGGLVKGGIYGGSNTQGTIKKDVTMNIHGGQVGVDEGHPGNIHGGGYGQSTVVTQNVDITIGKTVGQSNPVVIFGDVYGGSALGSVNSSSSYHTNVTLNAGTIYGSLYGGALGSNSVAANVNGPVAVKVYGGSVKKTSADGSGGVYGANNIKGSPQNSVTVDIYGTDPAGDEEYALYSVYGGGNKADYSYNNYPTVTVHGCDNSIEYVYGGGNAAAVKSTNVTIYGGDKIGNVFGGGNGQVQAANVNGNTNVKIYGGTIGDVYGGSNTNGSISGTINVTVDAKAEAGKSACPIDIDNVYGGGNQAASNAGNITIGCAEHIGAVYGGANQANISGNINLNIESGHIDNVFGGNNKSGTISGTITVTVEDSEETCGMEIGNVYGGGNQAAYSPTSSNYPVVNIYNGTITGNVYGGGLGATAVVTGNPQVTIGKSTGTVSIEGDVYGGGDAGNVVGTPVVKVVNNCNTEIANVYGGGNAADVSNTNVTIDGGTISGAVFGGGHGNKNASPQTEANVTNNVSLVVTGGTIHQVFGGSNSKGTIGGNITFNISKGNSSCEMHIDEVYGGGNEADGNAGTINIGCTGGQGEGIGDVYGGANQADVGNDITLNITGGSIERVFGGNNQSGTVSGTIVVNVNWDQGSCGVNSLDYVYGGGNQAAYNHGGNYPTVNIISGTINNNVYGGGLGQSAKVTGNPHVNLQGGTVTGYIFGGGDAAPVTGTPVVTATYGKATNIFGGGQGATAIVTGGTQVDINQTQNKTLTVTDVFGGGDAAAVAGSGTTLVNMKAGSVTHIYGGGNQAGAATTQVAMTGGTVTGGLYGGCNTSGTVTGDISVGLTGGTVGADGSSANVHGGGYGSATASQGNVTVSVNGAGVNIYGDVYGGSALGNVNNEATDLTKVQLDNGTIHGCLYGGGLGDATNAALVYGQVQVIVNGGTVTDKVFGCNNVNGTPKSSVSVVINGTDVPVSGYALSEVYGGGNQADYSPAEDTDKTSVTVNGCDNSIGVVYGGGNAADVPSTQVTIWGGTINQVFGGGHGDKTANPQTEANVSGDVNVNIYGGTITEVFGGSNSKGNITGTITVNITSEQQGENDACTMNITDVYGGGNQADGNAGDLNIGCGAIITGNIYGGAKNANINNDIHLTISGGSLHNVFGGNNVGGTISGTIQVDINKDNNCNTWHVDNVYGGGNQAAYNHTGTYPIVNLMNGTVTQNVYGGGLGQSATVTGNPHVNLQGGTVTGYIFGGGDAAPVTGTPVVTATYGKATNIFGGGKGATAIVTGGTQVDINQTQNKTLTITDVFGGGDAAAVEGTGTTIVNMKAGSVTHIYGGGNKAGAATTQVAMTGGTVTGGLYGGCNTSGTVTGDISVGLTGGTVGADGSSANVHGGGYGSATASQGNVTVTVNNASVNIWGDVYGGSALGNVNNEATDLTKVQLDNGTIHGCLYGGGLGDATYAALVNGQVQVIVNGGTVTDKVFGCNNVNGTPKSSVSVVINGTDVPASGYALSEVYGGGNQADYSPAEDTDKTSVTVNGCDNSIGVVYGGGNAADVTSTNVTIWGGKITQVFGGGHGDKTANPQTEANVSGNVNVNIYGGTIKEVFGGSNSKGDIDGEITVEITSQQQEDYDLCTMNITDVYGGGNQADGNAGTLNIGCGAIITGNVYGGAKNADIGNDIHLTISGGTLHNVFGGNNMGGSISGSILVDIDRDDNCNTWHVDSIFGAGNEAAYTGNPTVNLLNGKVSENVYGAGYGATAKVTGNPQVNLDGGSVTGKIFGGGALAPVEGNPTVTTASGDATLVYAGGQGSTAIVTGNTTAQINGGSMTYVFGGGEEAAVTGDVTVNVTGGTVSKEVYGGGALAHTNTDGTTKTTTVNLTGGTVGDVYGGGLGSADVAALVYGPVTVTLSGTALDHVFGCNNVNGTPKDTVNVIVISTTSRTGEHAYHVDAVYGGGNEAEYIPSDHSTFVYIKECDNNIQYVYGGGNAASTPSTHVKVEGGTMEYVFGGGNGERGPEYAANVGFKNDGISTYGNGVARTEIYGGTIAHLFGGSNSNGNIRATAVSLIDQPDDKVCDTFNIGEVYGAGNEAYMNGKVDLQLGCIPGFEVLYGGAKNADINQDIKLTITSGKFGKIFGGNNKGGTISGSITVNIEETGCKPVVIDTLYGGGNLAAYTVPDDGAMNVNVRSCTSIGTIFGGGLGDADDSSKGVVTGDTHVNVQMVKGAHANKIGNKLGEIGTIFGGGNIAAVNGDTYVNIATDETTIFDSLATSNEKTVEGANITGNIYGGGNAADVTGQTHVTIGKE